MRRLKESRKRWILLLLSALIFFSGGEVLYAEKKQEVKTGRLSKAIFHYELGRSLFLSRKYAKAKAEFRLAIQLDTGKRKSVSRLSRMYLKKIERWEKRKIKELRKRKREEEIARKRRRILAKREKKRKREVVRTSKEVEERLKERKKRKKERRARFKRAELESGQERVVKVKRKEKKEKEVCVSAVRAGSEESFDLLPSILNDYPELKKKAEVNLHYRRAREYLKQKKLRKAIAEFELVKSKIDREHPYFIPCIIYIKQAKTLMSEQ